MRAVVSRSEKTFRCRVGEEGLQAGFEAEINLGPAGDEAVGVPEELGPGEIGRVSRGLDVSSKKDVVARGLEAGRYDLRDVVHHADSADHRGGIDRLAVRFVVERDVAGDRPGTPSASQAAIMPLTALFELVSRRRAACGCRS